MKPQIRVHVGALRQRLGQRLEVEIDHPLPGLRVIATETTEEPVTGVLTVESIERGVSVAGTLRVPWRAECRRCLDPIDGVTDADVDEIFQIDAPPDSEIYDFDGDTVVLDEMLRENVMSSLPLSPLCGPDCEGPDPIRYRPGLDGDQTSDEDDDPERRPAGDPRWAALDELDL